MKKHTTKTAVLAVSVVSLLAAAGTRADTFTEIFRVSQASADAAKESQQKIDKIADQTRDLLQEYKTVMKQVDGLKVYNGRLEKQIANQEKRVGAIENSIDEVTVIQRQITPLVIRMIDGLEQFVALDKPFHLRERQERLAFLRANLDRADVTTAEKFRQVLEAYKIENEYGRKIDAYKDTIQIDGADREVNVLRVGRIALLFQTTDLAVSGYWDSGKGSWEKLDSNEYRSAIQNGIRMANKQASIDLLTLPIAAPETL
jgi:septal ring factor EnvC (AmiA/AmiB activator)